MTKLSAIDNMLSAKHYLQPAFLICVAVLAIAGSGMSIAIRSFGVHLKKMPLPLKKSFDVLDEKALAPYKVIRKVKIENRDIIESLGTKDYIQWVLEDRSVSANSAVRKCLLFITYYELPDRVPHVPEECYAGGGYERLASEGVTLKINKSGLEEEVRGRYVVFGSTNSRHWRESAKFPVLYLLIVNGVYTSSREEARMTLNKNIFGRYSYFCKVEVVFRFGAPSKKEAVAAGQKLLGVVLPILEGEHFPELED